MGNGVSILIGLGSVIIIFAVLYIFYTLLASYNGSNESEQSQSLSGNLVSMDLFYIPQHTQRSSRNGNNEFIEPLPLYTRGESSAQEMTTIRVTEPSEAPPSYINTK